MPFRVLRLSFAILALPFAAATAQGRAQSGTLTAFGSERELRAYLEDLAGQRDLRLPKSAHEWRPPECAVRR